jgi:DNA-directed RNA polymerase subunit alpha
MMRPSYEYEELQPKLVWKKKKEYFNDDQRHIAIYEIETPKYFGVNIAHSLKRVIMSSTAGTAVVALRVNNEQHAFASVEGVKESLQHVAINLKKLAIRIKDKSQNYVYLKINKKGPGEVLASHIEENDQIDIINKNQIICTLDKNRDLDMEIVVARGINYKKEEDHRFLTELPLGFFTVDSSFGNVVCEYEINYQSEGENPYELIEMTIDTNGVLTPCEVLDNAAYLLHSMFGKICQQREIKVQEAVIMEHPMMNRRIEEKTSIDLPIRAKNSLISHGIETIRDLVQKTHKEIKAIEGLGEVSFQEIEQFLLANGLALRKEE